MRCVIWAAVSSRVQASQEKDSIPLQISAARDLIESNEAWHEVHDPLIIPGHSREYIFLADAANEMPVYAELMGLARSHSIDLVICRGRDRLGRMDALVSQVEAYLRHHGCQVQSLEMPTPLQDPDDFSRYKDRAGLWTSAIERARAEDEIAQLRARHRFGMRRRIRDGLHAGNPPFGYRLGDNGVGEPYKPEARVVRFIFDLFLQGQSLRAITRRLPAYATERHPKSVTRVQYIVENPYYAGHVSYHRLNEHGSSLPWGQYLVAEGKHEAIIDRPVWEQAQAELRKRREQGPRTPFTPNPLSGFVYCGYCGGRMTIDCGRGTKHRYYFCKAEGCDRPTYRNSIEVSALEQTTLELLEHIASRPEVIAKELEQQNSQPQDRADLEVLAGKLAQKRRALDQWISDYEMGLIARPEFYTHKTRLEDEIAAVAEEIQALQERLDRLDSEAIVNTLTTTVAEARAAFAAGGPKIQELKAGFRQIGLRLEIHSKTDVRLRLAP